MANGLPHGFKAEAERISEAMRTNLNKSPTDPLLAEELATILKIHIHTMGDIGLSRDQLDRVEDLPYCFSALTLKNHQGKDIIVHNEFHSPGRQQSNLMHEMGHILCKHPLPKPTTINGYPFLSRNYNKQHEVEAETLGGVLQVTRKGLLWALKRGMKIDEMASYYHASKSMINYRISKSGVRNQMKYWK